MNRFLISMFCMSCISFIYGNHLMAESARIDNISIDPLYSIGIVEVSASKDRQLVVMTDVKNGKLYVECFINGFIFSEKKAGMQHVEGEGHIRLYVNGEHIETLYEAAFIVKGLSIGNHDIQVVVAKNDRTPYELEESIQITI